MTTAVKVELPPVLVQGFGRLFKALASILAPQEETRHE